ncbi:MAG: general stress protein [Pauljensenia sp.]|jgi:hypothetical protein|nr:general stress protein [Pauljensenia sp.]
MPVVMEPKMPTGTEVASYQTYAQARAAVDFLSDSGFDVSSITIVGTDLHMVERVTGRLTIARASLSGASSGALWGALMGMFMSAGQNAGGTGLWVGGGIVIGALVGMALSALMFIVRGRNRDLVSSQQVVALRYAILASADIDRAFMLLQRTPGNTTRPKRARAEAERPRKDSVGFFPDGRPRFGAATKDGTVPGGDAQPQAAAASSTNEAVAPSQGMRAESSVSSASESGAAQTVPPAQPAPAQPAPEGRDDAPASSPEGDQTEASDQRS